MPARVASEHPSEGGPLGAALSNAIVRLLAEYTGRGPTKARTTIRGNVVVEGNPANHGQIIAVFNDTGVANLTMNVQVVNNTVVAAATKGSSANA